ncbi:transcriptional regulator [Brucella tritici]|jgi:predicted ArsR family transcriptional regulator|uniref:Transcriptional regulator n=1 Tax=Brucella tritici TaxID=94626 RepID=A0A6L3YI18_9HYPH|nr:metalloregulator ArsR/SmtB family transcription factor [Brucella tritici]KAB2666704.1 transcriptional regulator [Brucella tritici]KAB2679653.1 transcriptional regulator [Brucella tritici]KAB2682511.1 transcriptional regulator [Brucella tritici]NKW09517.1 transcriptional regulator [Brucella tritici]
MLALKMRGAQTAAAIGDHLGTTGEAVRQQLVRLAEEGLVSSHSVSQGVGRPSLFWDLTEAGNKRFPDTHADLTVQLLHSVRTILGDDALDTLIAHRETETRRQYQTRLKDLSLDERVKELADIRSAEGYMADAEKREDGSWLLIENHCPICAAADACQGFCRSELQVFRAVLGPDVSVNRTEHILAGARRCAYVIAPTA